jgi:hypothetical protein
MSLLSDYATPRQLAEELGRHPGTIERWRRTGKGPPITRIGKTPYYHRESVVAWLRSLETGTPASRKRRSA